MQTTRRVGWAAIAAVFLATAVFVPVRIRYRQNEPLPAPAPGAVAIANYAFTPPALAVDRGPVTITFTNTDGTAHTVTADDGSFDTGRLEAGGHADVVVTKTVAYHCSFHRSMTGTIEVKG